LLKQEVLLLLVIPAIFYCISFFQFILYSNFIKIFIVIVLVENRLKLFDKYLKLT
jgi:hypothetical protein